MYRKNVAGQFIHFQGEDATTHGIKSGVAWTVRRCIDGTFAAGGGTVTEDGTTGWYKYAMSQADTNGNDIGFNFTGTGAVPQTVNVVTTAANPTDAVAFGLSGFGAVTLADGVTHGGTTTLLRLGSTTSTPAFYATNSGGDAVTFESSAAFGSAANFLNSAIGTYTQFGSTTAGATINGSGQFVPGLEVTSQDGAGFVVTGDSYGIIWQGRLNGNVISCNGLGANVPGLTITGQGTGAGLAAVGGSTGAGFLGTPGAGSYGFNGTLSATGAIADKLLGRNLAGGSDGGRTVQDALRAGRNKVAFDVPAAGQFTVYAEDDATPAWTGTYARGAAGLGPLTSTDPA